MGRGCTPPACGEYGRCRTTPCFHAVDCLPACFVFTPELGTRTGLARGAGPLAALPLAALSLTALSLAALPFAALSFPRAVAAAARVLSPKPET